MITLGVLLVDYRWGILFLVGLSWSLILSCDAWIGSFVWLDRATLHALTWLVCIVGILYVLISASSTHLIITKLLVIVSVVFISCDHLLILFLCFELALIPVLFLITSWGSQAERTSASNYLLSYGVTPSLLMLCLLCWSPLEGFSLVTISYRGNWLIMILTLNMLIKAPLYGCHTWLAKAHVEAPVVGSVLLAGILLKLGTLGYLRLFEVIGDHTRLCVVVLIVLGTTLGGWATISQSDLKSYVAYSSVTHINMLLWALHALVSLAGEARWVTGWAHGLVASMLFVAVGTLIHHQLSRLVFQSNLFLQPFINLCWVGVLMFNYRVPPSIGFLAELAAVLRLINWCSLVIVVLVSYGIACCFISLHLWLPQSTVGVPNVTLAETIAHLMTLSLIVWSLSIRLVA